MVNFLKEIPLHSNFASCVLFFPSCSTHPLCGRNGLTKVLDLCRISGQHLSSDLGSK